jgi:CubicO group peptidase (beta-lactamase class C family)
VPENARLKAALDSAFEENTAPPYRNTEAVVVVHNGRIVAERYAPGIGPQTPLIGYSATNSVVNALIGILVREKKLSVYGPAPVARWAAGDHKRHAISIDELLRMESGLAFPETDSGFDRPSRMLFLERDMARYAERTRLEFSPGMHWSYSSASYLILSQIVRNAVGGGPGGRARICTSATIRPFGNDGRHA